MNASLERYERMKANGICPQCGKKEHIDGSIYCKECLEYKRESSRHYRELNGARRTSYEEEYTPCVLREYCMYGGTTGTCDYYIANGIGHRRTEICGVGLECTVFEPLSENAKRKADSIRGIGGGEETARKAPPIQYREFMQIYKTGATDAELANGLGRSITAIRTFRKKHGLPLHPARTRKE